MDPSGEERVPRLLEVELGPERAPGALPAAPEPWASSDPGLDAAGRHSGTALALARFLDPQQPAPALVVCVGDCVRRGVPTAARATLVAPSPLTGRLAEGQVGSDLGRRLARVADALVLRGRTALPGAVLHVRGAAVELLSFPELAGADPERTAELLAARLGPCAVLRCGVAGERGVPFANLAAGSAPPSFVGRGGLGAALGATGLKAIAVSAPPVPGVENDELTRSLAASPRLRARGEGGTLELGQAFGARGDLYERGYASALDARAGARLSAEAQQSGQARHGCKGCPTPCGWVFERSDGRRQGAHFSAVYALGTNLGLDAFDDALFLLDACDRLGLDAKEAGACLALRARAIDEARIAGAPLFGDRAALLALLEGLAARTGDGAALSDGAAAFAARHGLEADAFHAAGEAARPVHDLAAVLGQCVSPRGAEPMRTFPFLVGDGVPRERIERLFAPFELPAGADDPRDPAGKGRLVWWHENLVAALDTTGFCAFSAAGLLSDGILDLDTLARLVAPRAEDGRGLLALGAAVVAMHLTWNERAGLELDERPAWAAGELARDGMLAEYRHWRGLDERGRLTERGSRQLATSELVAPSDASRSAGPTPAERPAGAAAAPPGAARTAGHVTVRGWGPLRAAIGGDLGLDLELPASAADVLRRAARECPASAAWLWRDGELVPAVYRSGERLSASSLVGPGDCLDLVVAVSGGSS